MINLILSLFEAMFPEYKSKLWATGDVPLWCIKKRHWIFFRKAMNHTKVVIYKAGHSACSQEVLLFWSKEDVESEIDRLGFGYPELVSRHWKNNQIVSTVYANGEVWYEPVCPR